MGDPYVHGRSEVEGLDLETLGLTNTGGIATWLERDFQALYPQRRVQAINAAVGSQDLTAAAAVLREISEVGAPDLVIVLCGNNESYNRKFESTGDFDAALQGLTETYARQLQAITTVAREHRLQTYVLTVPTNVRDWLPSDAHQPLAKSDLLDLLARKDWQQLLARLRDAGMQHHALYSYFQAKAYEDGGDDESAYASYLAAKDRDFNLIRAHSRWNALVRQTGADLVRVLDLERILRRYAHHGVPGFDLFHDHCHFKVAANLLVARQIALFHQRNENLPAVDLPALDIPEVLRRSLHALYEIKEAKWKRLGELKEFDFLGPENRENVQRQFERESAALEAIDRAIGVYEENAGAGG
jgi:hypothetical protein